MNEYRRARQPEQKEERRLALLLTAGDYLRSGGDVRELSLNELARLASMTKSNVYRYFESREAVLLALLTAEWGVWTVDFTERATAEGPTKIQLPRLVELMSETIADHPLLGQLTAVLPSVLEHNLSESAILTFKKDSLEFFEQVARLLHQHCPELEVDAYVGWLVDLVTIIAGLYPFAHPSNVVKKVHETGAIAALHHDYLADLKRMALALANARKR